MEFSDQAGGIGEGRAIPGETAETIHVVDVEMDRFAGELALPEFTGDVTDGIGRFVAPAGLLVAERPARRQVHAAGEGSVLLHDFGQGRAQDEIETKFGTSNLVGELVRLLCAQIDLAVVGAIKQDAKGRTIIQSHQKGDVDVQGVVARVITGLIECRQLKMMAAGRETHRSLAQTVILGPGGDCLL